MSFIHFIRAMDFLLILSCGLTLPWRVQVILGFSQMCQEVIGKHRALSSSPWMLSAGRSFAASIPAQIQARLFSPDAVMLGRMSTLRYATFPGWGGSCGFLGAASECCFLIPTGF